MTTTWRAALFALAVASWLICFLVLRRWGTWTPFAVAGPTLAALALLCDAETRALLRPSLGKVAAGLLAGAIMVAGTHAAFEALAAIAPDVRASARTLYALLGVVNVSPAERACMIAVIASSEEIVFRGAIAGAIARPQVVALRVVGLAAGYASAMATLGSPLLVGCAFVCGIVWGAVRVVTRSLLAPIVTHVVWDLGVLILWPLL